MLLTSLTLFTAWYSAHSAAAFALNLAIPPVLDAITNHVVELTAGPRTYHHALRSSLHLARRGSSDMTKRQTTAQEDITTLGGRLYIANVTLAGKVFSLIIDTGSSDTWVASSKFQCDDPNTYAPIPVQQCGFGPFYNQSASKSFQSINHDFDVYYSGGEFLEGIMGTELFGIGGVSRGQVPSATVRQTIGVVNEGYWFGDGISSGLMGLGFPALAEGVNSGELTYTSVIYTLFKDAAIPPVFSLALNRTTTTSPRAGGFLAIGGIPNISNDGKWIQTPITPYVSNLYAFYAINVTGFDITPPTQTKSAATKPTPTSYASSKQNMIIDSGTSLMYVPDEVATYIASLFVPPARYNSDTNAFIVSCTALAPRVGVIIGGRTFFISQDDLMNRGPGAVGGASVGAASGECAVATQKAMGGTLVLGDTWLKNVIVVFDVANATDVGRQGTDRDGNGAGSVRIVGREKY